MRQPLPLSDGGAHCRLDEEAMVARVDTVRRLYARFLRSARRRDPDTVELHFDPAAEPEVRALVRDEQACCEFFRFEVARRGGDLLLRASVPAARREYLESLLVATART